MELKDFITSAISNISEAVSEADEKLKPMGGLVNPGRDSADIGGMTFDAPANDLEL